MIRNNCFRGGKVHVRKVKCKTCIFHPGNKMHLPPGRRDGMVQEATASHGAIVCHSTLGTNENAVCRGFFDMHATQALRLATAMNAIEYQEVTDQ